MWPLACIALNIALAAALSGLWLALILTLAIVAGLHGDAIEAVALAGALLLGGGLALSPPVLALVTGLAGLFERRVRVGDWISAAAGEGSVRRISLTTVEVETPTGGRLLIPTADLLKHPVTRWTLGSPCAARIVLTFPVSLGSDPERVIAALVRAAAAAPLVLAEPAPSVTLESIGSGALHFALSLFVADAAPASETASRLRIGILQALRADGIEIPREQRDIYLRDLDGLRQSIAAVLAERRKHLNPEAPD